MNARQYSQPLLLKSCCIICWFVFQPFPLLRADNVAAPLVAVTNLQSLHTVANTRQRTICNLDLETTVCAVDKQLNVIALKDDSGTAACELDLLGTKVSQGERIRLTANRCEIIRRTGTIAIVDAPLLDIGGVHAVQEKTGRVKLTAGLHQIHLFYFNAKNPAELSVSYAGPGISPQPIPAAALFHQSDELTNPQPGLQYFCYDDTPATLDEVRYQEPTKSGAATNFDIGLRQPEQYVAMQFRGLLAVPVTGDYEFTVRSDDGSEFYLDPFQLEISPLNPGPPVASKSQLIGDSGWVTLTGRVQFVGQQKNGLEIALTDQDHTRRIWLASPEHLPLALLPGAIVRATGVATRVSTLDGQNSVMLTVVGAENFHVLNLTAEQWSKYPPTTVSNVLKSPLAIPIARLSGQVCNLRPDGGFVLDDPTGAISARTGVLTGLANGMSVEVLGGISPTRDGFEVSPAYCRKLSIVSTNLPLLTSAAQVQQLSAAEAARQYPVQIHGVITCLIEWLGAVVQDGTRGVFFSHNAAWQDGLEVGDFVDISGFTAVGDFAPVITANSVKVSGRAEMPVPAEPSWNQLISGNLDAQYAELRGVVTDVTNTTITLLTDSGKINVQIHDLGAATLRPLDNSLVRIRGCLLAEWDAATHQLRVGEVKMRNATIEVSQPPMNEPFSAPGKKISDLLLFDLHASGFQRVKISGQIVARRDSEFFLMQDGKGLRFRPRDSEKLSPGDLVDVVGIPDVSGPSPLLHEAVVRRTGLAPLPSPLPWPWPDDENPGHEHDAVRVRTGGRLIGIHNSGNQWMLELQTGLRAYRATVNTAADLAAEFPLESRLELTGVYAIQAGQPSDKLGSFALLLNSLDDIRLLERPPWWTLRRLLLTVAVLITILAAAVLWIHQLRRKVEERTRLLEQEHTRRERAERDRAVEIERSRIARDLHDDLGSNLTEIRVMANTGSRTGAADEKSPPIFNAIADKARQLVSALDVIVWAVNPEANSLQSLADYLSTYTTDYLEHTGITSRFKIPMELPGIKVDGRVRHDLFLALKETLHNIVQHSHATEVEFRLRMQKNLLEIDVVDDGVGFELNTASEAGNGLKNIPQRLARLGGSAQLNSTPGKGTIVNIRLLLPAAKGDNSK